MKWGWAIEIGMLLVPIFWMTTCVYVVYYVCVDYGLFLINFLSRPPL